MSNNEYLEDNIELVMCKYPKAYILEDKNCLHLDLYIF